jgi:hypothetical protein
MSAADPAPVFLTKAQLAARWLISTRSLERKMRDGTAPAYVRAPGSQKALFPHANIIAKEQENTHASRAAEVAAQCRKEHAENGCGKGEGAALG